MDRPTVIDPGAVQPAPSTSLGSTEAVSAGTVQPTLSDSSGLTVTWSTTCTRVSDGGSVSVTSSTSTTPSFTAAAGQSYILTSTATASGGRSKSVSTAIDCAASGNSVWTVLDTYDFTDATTSAVWSTTGSAAVLKGDGVTTLCTLTRSTAGTVTTWTMQVINGTGLVVSLTAGSGTAAAIFTLPGVTAGKKKIMFQAIVQNGTMATGNRGAGLASTTSYSTGYQLLPVMNLNGADNQLRTLSRSGGSGGLETPGTTPVTITTSVCMTVLNDGKQVRIYTHDSTSFIDPESLMTGPIYGGKDWSVAQDPVGAYARLFATPYGIVISNNAAGATTMTKCRLLEAPADT